MKKISMLLVVVLLCTSGCATYRPLVDRPGPDYEQDLRECQEHAEGEAGPGTGAVFGALLGAAFGGDANYAWVHRDTLPESDYTDLHLVRRAKKFAGFTGLRCEVSNYGDMIQITPRGMCQTVFVTWEDSL